MNWDKIDSKKAELVQRSIASKWFRFIGAIIDRVLGYGITFSIGFLGEIVSPGSMDILVQYPLLDNITTITILLLYYLIFEFYFQKTIGKFIFKMKVVNEYDASKPNFKTILKRTVSRIIGIEALFYLFGNHLWHDRWSDTAVISEKKFEEQNELDEIGDIGSMNIT
ncbi:MAG: RDD family protein [Chitinophagales bacterium]|nr:RDD family protein [Chitinophagales bacterium]